LLLDDLQRAVGDGYTIKRELSGGGMSHVFVATEHALGRDVVLKVLPAGLAEGMSADRFVREIKLAASLQQANIVPVLASGMADRKPYYVMPFIEGESLRTRLDHARPMSVREAVAVLRDVARGLAYAHSHGVVHRDIKPENILLSGAAAVVTDFGIAKALQASKTQAPGGTLTVVGTSIGTPAYMAPEQAAGDPAIDHRADIYAWGLVAYEMLAGKHPFAGKSSPQQYLAAQLAEMPAPLQRVAKGLPPALAALVMRCIEKDPAKRPASANDLLDQLESVVSGELTPGAARGGRNMLLAAAAAVLLLGAVVAVWRARTARPTAVAAAVTRLAVLPFENRGAPEDEYFADGIADEVRGKLSSLPGMQVVARTSSAQYKKSTKSPADIARELGVDYLLTGTVQWEKGTGAGTGQVKVTPELVEVRSGSAPVTKWSEPLQAVISDVFKVQADIASRVAQKLDVALGATERARLSARPTTNVLAYDAYLQGEEVSDALSKADPASMQRAIRLYERATQLDTGFVKAWARLSQARTALSVSSFPDPAVKAGALAAANRALSLAPNSPDGHLAFGIYKSGVAVDINGSLQEVRAALALAPDDPDVLSSVARMEASAGQWDEAARHGSRAVALDPRSTTALRRQGEILLWMHRCAEAGPLFDRAIAISPGNLTLRSSRSLCYLQGGHLDSARALVASTAATVGRDAALAYFATYWDLGWMLEPRDQDRLLSLPVAAFDDDRVSWALVRQQIHLLRGHLAQSRVYSDSARITLDQQIAATPTDGQLHAQRGLALAGLSRRDEAIREATRGFEAYRTAGDERLAPYMGIQLARVYTILGEKDKAVETLESLVSSKFYLTPAWLRIDPNFTSLRGMPRFDRLVAGS
jgi:serine/threonine-protein kinase